jgi:glucuronate isomerase
VTAFIHDDFLLQSDTARQLYHDHAADQPIIDYHCHLPPEDLAQNKQFRDLTAIWLEGDHYKWRAMRANGVTEKYCTGDADPYDKFMAWARTVPNTLRNPLYHWTHLELKRYFGIDSLLNEETAPEIWKACNEQLASDELRPHAITKQFKVEAIGTTDDPADTLEHHQAMKGMDLSTRVYPAFRPDAALAVDDSEGFNAYADRLGQAANHDTGSYQGFCEALHKRHDFFHAMGSRLSDHGLSACYACFASESVVQGIFDKARSGKSVTAKEKDQFATAIMVLSGQLDSAKGWVKQLHLGALRNTNTRKFKALGRDTGFDSIADTPQAVTLRAYLDRLDEDDNLPKTIVYNLNPRDNYLFASMVGNFQDGSVAGKMQLGSGWWYLDQKEAMEWQINALSNIGLLSRFVGMLTDSRSFLSYPRHEYFRRILCNLLGDDVKNGVLPSDMSLLGEMVENICYHNAKAYFSFPE